MITVGALAPLDIKVTNQDGKSVSLGELKGQKVVIFFYPKDNTPGCTKEACSFRDESEKFKKKNIAVIGISADSEKSHQKFINKYDLNFPLWADENKEISTAFGVYGEKSLYGIKYMGITRSTFILDENGKIIKIYPKVKPVGHAIEVLKDLETL